LVAHKEELTIQNTTKEQAFFRARQAGVAREIAMNSGGTGDLRKEVSGKEKRKKKTRRKMARSSRRQQR